MALGEMMRLYRIKFDRHDLGLSEAWVRAVNTDHAHWLAGKYYPSRTVKSIHFGLDPRTPVGKKRWQDFVTRQQMRRVGEQVGRDRNDPKAAKGAIRG